MAREIRRARAVPRRDFLKASGVALAASGGIAGCDLLATDPASEGERNRTRAQEQDKEAPELAEQVEDGDLPPLEERLPEKPLVVEPVDRVGVYGGTWRTTLLGPSDSVWMLKTIGYEHLVRWDREWTKVVPNIAESFEFNDDGTEYVFHLRPGMKWSDGEPFTADDLVFANEDVTKNPDLNPVQGDNPATIEKIDTYTARVTFEEPEGLFLENQATAGGTPLVTRPFHYLKQFHKKYNPDADSLAAEEGLEDWVQLYQRKGGSVEGTPYNAIWFNSELPRLHAWKLVVSLDDDENQVVVERNPYYWKVDPDGRQLPYLDQVVYELIQDAEVLTLKISNGEIDMMNYQFNGVQNKPVIAQHREDGDYRLFDLIPSSMNAMIISLNLVHQDPVKREMFQNKDFRIGLSHAINREEIIDVTLQRQGEPWQPAPRPESEQYDEEMAKQYTEYDPDLANEHLDRAGYTERNDDGFRLDPDGKPISFQVETMDSDPDYGSPWVAMLELVRDYWRDVGIEMQIQNEERSLFYTRKEANEHDAATWFGSPGGLEQEAYLQPRWYLPVNNESNYAIPWAQWYNNDPKGEEPPPEVKDQMALYDQVKATVDPDERAELMAQVLAITKERFYAIGTVLQPDSYGIVKNNFHNVPDPMIGAWLLVDPAYSNPEQYFIED